MKFARQVAAALKSWGMGNVGGSSSVFRIGNGSRDWEQEAGDLWKNSIVLACLKWQQRVMPEAPPIIYTRRRDGNLVPTHNHKLLTLLKKPNPYWDGNLLMNATVMSLTLSGNAYWYKVRDQLNRVVEIWWMPHWMVKPKKLRESNNFIDYYEYNVGTERVQLRVEDVVHFRDGINPENIMEGLAPLTAVMREVATDNECSVYSAAILSNMGVPGVIIKPPSSAHGGQISVPPDKAEKIKREWMARFTGDKRGEPYVLTTAMDVTSVAFSPEQLALDKMRRIPEERVTAAIGIPAVVVGFGAGLDRSTFSNMKEAREAAYESHIIPLQRYIAQAIETWLLPEFSNSQSETFGFDISNVRALQADVTALYMRASVAYRSGMIKRGQAKAIVGLPTDGEADEVYFTDFGGKGKGQAPIPNVTDNETARDADPKSLVDDVFGEVTTLIEVKRDLEELLEWDGTARQRLLPNGNGRH